MKTKILVTIIIVGMLVFICGCVEEEKDEGGTSPPAGVITGTVAFQVTDKVTDEFKHVNITFSEIRLFKQLDEENESYIVVMDEPKTVDLVFLNLSQINATLDIAEIEVGNYSKLWFNVSKAIGVLKDTNETVNITVPSNWLKIQQLHLFNITKGNHTIIIDIDLEHSIHPFHGGEEYKFIPVISSMEHTHDHKLKFRVHDQSKIKNMVGNRAPAIDILVNDTLVKKNAWVDSDVDIEFNATGTFDIDGDPLTFEWDFGDGDTAEGAVVNHSFDGSKKVYKVTLTVFDGTDEAIGIITINVHVNGNGQGSG
jgi:hypothetical protein